MKIEFVADLPTADAHAVAVLDAASLSAAAQALDTTSKGALSKAAKAARFSGAPAAVCEVLAPAGVASGRVVMMGLGKDKKLSDQTLQKAGAAVVKALLTSGAQTLVIDLAGFDSKTVEADQACANVAFGAVLASYRGYDTLGETTVVFTAGVGVIALLRRRRDRKQEAGEKQDAAQKQGVVK